MKPIFSILTLLIFGCVSRAQSIHQLDSVLNQFDGNSKELINNSNGKLIISFGKKSLKHLASFFEDTTTSKVFSLCNNRWLTKGELAMVMADHIEMMPYFQVTGIQNCTRTYCERNPNRIEYYFDPIKSMGRLTFKANYITWLNSKSRRKSYGKIN